jgi:hypothetical protein
MMQDLFISIATLIRYFTRRLSVDRGWNDLIGFPLNSEPTIKKRRPEGKPPDPQLVPYKR